VGKYSGFAGYQDQIIGGAPGSSELLVSAALLGFGSAAVWKRDAGDGGAALSGAVFELDEWSGSLSGWKPSGVPVTWNAGTRRYETATLTETRDNAGRFLIRETAAPYAYLSGWSAEINIASHQGTLFYLDAPNTPVKLKLRVIKKDKNTGKGAQGDASLANAKYGLYMNESIEHPNGTLYRKDQKLAEAVTNAAGEIAFENLLPALYYIKEITPSSGYLLDSTKYEIDGRCNGTETTVTREVSVREQVKKQRFELVKIGSGGTGTELSLLKAGIKVYLISGLADVRSGKLKPTNGAWSYKDFMGYNFSNEKTAMIDGVHTPELFTDSLGHLLSPELPYGSYVVIESTTPAGYLTINPFIVTIAEDSRTAQPWRVFDDKEISYFISIIKKDAQTGNVILNKTAGYRIFDLDAKAYVTMKTTYPSVVLHGTEDNPFYTDATGSLITPEKLKYGHYRLDEVTAPEGYVLAGHEQTEAGAYNPGGRTVPRPAQPVYIEFGKNAPVYLAGAGSDVLEVTQFNEQQKGKLIIEKRAEVPESVATGRDGMLFSYVDKPLAGAVFHVIADGDVVAQDGSGDVIFKDAGLVAELVTDADGHAWADDLPIGNYLLREVAAPTGFLPAPEESFSVTPTEQEQQFSFLTRSLTDDRQRLGIVVMKAEEASGFPLKGAEFSLYAAEDISFGTPAEENLLKGIKALFTGCKPFNLIKKDALVAKAVADEKGRAMFSDLPPGKYFLRETKAPDGFRIAEDWQPELILAYNGKAEKELTLYEACENKVFGHVELIKTGERFKAINTGGDGSPFIFEELALEGIIFEIRDEKGNVVCELETNEKGYAKSIDLPIGHYTLSEKNTPAGYLPIEDRAFEIAPRNSIQAENFMRFELRNERRRIAIEVKKTDKSDGTPLKGAVFALYSKDIPLQESANSEKDGVGKIAEVIAGEQGAAQAIRPDTELMRVMTDGDGVAVFEDVPAGVYMLAEVQPPEGYLVDEEFLPLIDARLDDAASRVVYKEACANDKVPSPAPGAPAVPKAGVPKTGDEVKPLLFVAICAAALFMAAVAAFLLVRLRGGMR
jgi:uncharacterized surface anchored protein